jgi:hypothetical protein
LLVATWTTAFLHAHRVFQTGHDTAAANAAFLALIDQGSRGVQAALTGTPYR